MKNKVTPILVAALIIFAFISGSLWTKVKTLEQGEGKDQKEEQVPSQQQQAPEKPQVLGTEDKQEIVKNSGAVKGAENAKVTIVEFSEYQCPFCKKYIDGAYAQIMENYGDKIKYVFRDYPLPFHQHAQKAAEASRCADEQDKYWDYHDKLFANQSAWSAETDATDTFIGYGTELGLNGGQFKDCLSAGKYTQEIKDDFVLGQKVGVSGTPTFFINGQKLVGAQPFENFKVIIEEELGR